MKKIILLGYMGCGKSTIGRRLAAILDIPWLDLDKLIEEKTGSSIRKLFEKKGEIYFRKLENQVLQEVLSRPYSAVISLGGGTPCYSDNIRLITAENMITIYLKASATTLFNRLVANKNKRPIVANKTPEELQEFVSKHLFERSFYYLQAQHHINIDGKSKDESAEEIAAILA